MTAVPRHILAAALAAAALLASCAQPGAPITQAPLLAPAEAGLEVGEYAPNAVKKTVVGVGHAGKEQVQFMVRVQLPGVRFDSADAADALAIAIGEARHLQGRSLRLAWPA